MRNKLLLFFTLFSLIFTPLLWGKKLPRLFFSKKVTLTPENLFKYKVKKGEWLYKILREQNIPEDKIPHLIKIIKKLNPHIKDLSNLKENETLIIPKAYLKTKTPSYLKKYKYKKLSYVVKPGDNVVKLLREKAGLPDKLIFNEYLTIFKILNPNLDINRLEIGDKVNIPIPIEKVEKELNKKLISSKSIITSFPQNKIKSQDYQKKNLELILKSLGFIITPGLKAYFPQKNGEWIYIDLKENILINTPWNSKILITLKKQHLKNKNLPYQVIIVPSFNPEQVIEMLAVKNKEEMKIWKSNENFIINKSEYSLEIKPQKLIKIKNKLFAIFILEKNIPNNLNLIKSFLNKFTIETIFLERKDSKKIVKIDINTLNPNYLFIPSVNSNNITQVLNINPNISSKTPLNLDYLISKNILEKKRINCFLLQEKNEYIKLYIDVLKHKNIVILKEKNPFISTFLSLNNYKVYRWL